MLKFLLLFLTHPFLVQILNPIVAQDYASSSELEKQVENYLKPFIEYDLFSGNVFVAIDGRILLNKTFGFASYEHNVKNTAHTKFRIASLSKLFTHLAVIQLAEKNLLNKLDKLSKYISDYPDGDKITIEHLINHSSGIPHLNDFQGYDEFAKENYSIEQIIDLFKDKPLEFEPGEKEGYSNSGYVLLTYIIEKASGLSYPEYLEKYIFEPAGMKNSGHDNGIAVIDHLADGYMMNLYGAGVQRALYYDPSIKIGGGSLYSTTEDLYLFDTAYKNGQLSETTEALYNEGTFGRSPGYNSFIWESDGVFISLLSNNYSTPIRRVAIDLIGIVRGNPSQTIDINESRSIDRNELQKYQGDYKIENDIITIEENNGILMEYENGDKWRGCRLIPTQQANTFFDTCYLESLTFTENQDGTISGFEWESGDKTILIRKDE